MWCADINEDADASTPWMDGWIYEDMKTRA
jgi:hypothetical protein